VSVISVISVSPSWCGDDAHCQRTVSRHAECVIASSVLTLLSSSVMLDTAPASWRHWTLTWLAIASYVTADAYDALCGRSPSVGSLCQQIQRCDPERVRQPVDGSEGRRHLATLQQANHVPVKPGEVRKLFLRQLGGSAMSAQVRREALWEAGWRHPETVRLG
jgi:hypothetical protein